MHICYLCSEYPPAPHGGIGTFVQTTARALVGRGHHVTVIGFNDVDLPAKEDDAGFKCSVCRGLEFPRWVSS